MSQNLEKRLEELLPEELREEYSKQIHVRAVFDLAVAGGWTRERALIEVVRVLAQAHRAASRTAIEALERTPVVWIGGVAVQTRAARPEEV